MTIQVATIAIDPGVHGLGLSLWDRSQRLILACYVEGDRSAKHECVKTTGPLQGVLLKYDIHPAAHLVVETPQIYRASQQKGSQKDITRLTLTVGAVVQSCLPYVDRITMPYPRQWKGQVPKHIAIERYKVTLTEDERACVVLPGRAKHRTDVWDAVGLGLWAR